MNCSYAEWSRSACSNPSLCENTYGFVNCSHWIEVIIYLVILGIIIGVTINYIKKIKEKHLEEEKGE